jgi:uncharacterized SAM-binding protein YcdF (DUF218 family)
MFFILSKLLSFFISPFNWLLIFVLLAFIVKNAARKKKLIILSVAWFILFSNPYLIHKLTVNWQPPLTQFTTGEQYPVGIVLTGFAGFEFKSRQGYFTAASDRFIQTVKLYQQKRIQKILIAGGSGSLDKRRQQLKEADFVKEQLMQMNIPEADILTENQSRNTYENAINSKKLLDSLQIKGPFLLITSAMHMRRSSAVFKKAGINFVTYPCNYAAINNPQLFFDAVTPTYKAFESWDNYLKEVVGLWVYKMTGKA